MDETFRRLIEKQKSCWPGLGEGDLNGFIENCFCDSLFWLEDGIEPWERHMALDCLLYRSLFEFVRSELNAQQTATLAKWEADWAGFRERGVFHERVREEGGGRFNWERERILAEEKLCRPIPKSHWWYWPPNEAK